ncbi:hypothetical protein CGLO_13055 [Colletotrichum gloeosporioides Cg-14]|uniref:Uncharacterized protein n=1 Tax=Colletotrichum gloeosporioides (strain Cg-14) TaxID=1237896 RepID=T0K713_COLGC|nr:hypothetical protein CGLO_13055 [Colletotrichum gloeosporioides Cg-14]
MARKRFQAQ